MTVAPETETDGRRRRALDSRARIVAAMLDLTEEGQISVSAELVAARAQVGLRSVFRHFKDMDSRYREMSLIIEARFRDEIAAGFTATDGRRRLYELIDRRTRVFERITPFKRAEAAHRHRSRFLEQDIQRLNARLRERLRQLLPALDHLTFEALDLLLSFESWDRMRREQGLAADEAHKVLRAAADRLLGLS